MATPKGFRDFLPTDALKRKFVAGKITEVFERFGFDPLETPALEFEKTLTGKYGEEEKLIYKFETPGGDKVALRYDQTVPLARVMSQYNDLPKPFKRYQIQPVWRGENTQKGRYREFVQCDADIVGSSSPLIDAEILNLVLEIYKNLNLEVIIKVNDRANFQNLDKKYVAAIDKLEKIGESAVLSEMVEKGMASRDAKLALDKLQKSPLTENLQMILEYLKGMGADTSRVVYTPTLARGLDYYTGMIFETVATGSTGSICSGGRYDNLISTLGGPNLAATGFGLGFDRSLEVLDSQYLLPQNITTTQVLITVFSPELLNESLDMCSRLRSNNINTEVWLNPGDRLDKQLKYADSKGIPYALIIGPDEASKGKVVLKDLKEKIQEVMIVDNIVDYLKNINADNTP